MDENLNDQVLEQARSECNLLKGQEINYFDFMDILGGLSSGFGNLSSEETTTKIHETLQRMGELLNVDRGYVVHYFAGETPSTHEWCKENFASEIRNFENSLSAFTPWRIQGNVCYEDVTIFPLITNGAEGAMIRVDDVTDKVRMEEMMIQSQKILSLGGIAAGMAHEIKSPLTGMILTADVVAIQNFSTKSLSWQPLTLTWRSSTP